MSSIREQIEAAIIKVMADADAQGLDAVKAAELTFPDVPDAVIWGCWARWDTDRTAAWWESMEKTIDAQAVNAAAQLSKSIAP